MEDRHLRYVRVLADYQFGKNAGRALFPETSDFIIPRKQERSDRLLIMVLELQL